MRNPKNQPTAHAPGQQQLEPISKKCTCGACPPPKPKLPEGTRRLKVQPKYVAHAYSSSIVPLIVLKGEWLRQWGFECRSHVQVIRQPGQLLIRLEKG